MKPFEDMFSYLLTKQETPMKLLPTHKKKPLRNDVTKTWKLSQLVAVIYNEMNGIASNLSIGDRKEIIAKRWDK